MTDYVRIIRERQRAIRREIGRRGIAMKQIEFDSGIAHKTLLSYFPADSAVEPAQIPGGAIFALCAGRALPIDLLSLLLPDGFQIVEVPEAIDHDELSAMCADLIATKNAAHHPDSEAGREIGPGEAAKLDEKAATLLQAVK